MVGEMENRFNYPNVVQLHYHMYCFYFTIRYLMHMGSQCSLFVCSKYFLCVMQ